LVVDDNSPDGTGDWAQQQATRDERLHCLIRARRLGLGTAAVAAFCYAVAHRFDWLATLDADWSHDPAALPAMWTAIRSTAASPIDCVIGSRYVAGGRIVGWPWQRRLASRAVNALSRTWLGLRTRDNSTALRIYRVSKLRATGFESLRSRGYAYLEESLWRLQQSGGRIIEVPVEFRDREAGSSKMRWREALQTLRDVLTIRFLRALPLANFPVGNGAMVPGLGNDVAEPKDPQS
jgi:dolichol-phosphate mannosyltransferase